MFFPLPNKLRNYPKGIISDRVDCEDADSIELKPLMLACRGPKGLQGWNTIPWVLTDAQAKLDGRKVLVIQVNDRTRARKVWIDAERDFLPLRYSLADSRAGASNIDMKIEYIRSADEWTPNNWTMRTSKNGELCQSIDATVTKCEINEAIPLENFQIDFPRGTVVIDMRNNSERYEVGLEGAKIPPRDNLDASP
jgi:hypothetical protein